MKLNKKFLAIMLAMGCVSAMGAISVSAESEENNSTIIEEPGDDGDDSDSDDLDNIDLGNDDIFGEPEDNSSNTDTDNTDNNTNNVPVIDNVTPTPVTPTTPIPSTPQTGDLGIILSSVAAALSAGGIAVSKRISK